MDGKKWLIMKRLVMCALVAILCFGTKAAAQDEAADDTRPIWGIKAAFDINIPGDFHGERGNHRGGRAGDLLPQSAAPADAGLPRADPVGALR